LEKTLATAVVISTITFGNQIYQDYQNYKQDKREEVYWNKIRGSLKETPQDTMERLYRRHLDQMYQDYLSQK